MTTLCRIIRVVMGGVLMWGTVACARQQSEGSLVLSAAILTEPVIAVEAAAQDRTDDIEDDSAAIRIGDPVSLRVRLSVEGEYQSPETIPLDGRYAPLVVSVSKPDGTEYKVMWRERGPVARGMGTPRRLEGGSVSLLDTFVFERMGTSADGHPQLEYVFDTPGTYQVRVSYRVGAALAEGGETMLEAGPLEVEVGPATIPGWDALKDAGILRWIGQRRWPNWQGDVNVQQVVQAADSPWLVDWTESLTDD